MGVQIGWEKNKMKIISTGGDWVNIANGDEWITFNHWDGRKKIIKK